MNNKEKFLKGKETSKRRQAEMDCKVFELKIQRNKLSKAQQKQLNTLFIEYKWLYNYALNYMETEKLSTFDTKIKDIISLDKDKNKIERTLTLPSQIKQELKRKMFASLKTLSTKKKRGMAKQVGRLKFKTWIETVPLIQYRKEGMSGGTYQFRGHNKVKISGIKKSLTVNGLKQLPKDTEIANANLIHRKNTSDYYLQVTCWVPKEENDFNDKANIGIDFGIKDDIVLSDGTKFQTKFEIPKRLKREQRKASKKTKDSKNQRRSYDKVKTEYKKLSNKKKDSKNKIVSYINNNFNYIAVQDENIKGWHSGLFGKQIQQSILGGIMAGLKTNPHTLIVNRWKPTSKMCPECGNIHSGLKLSHREYVCECGYVKDRDIHAANNILLFAQDQIGTERIDFKPVEFNSSALDSLVKSLNREVRVNYEAGSPSL